MYEQKRQHPLMILVSTLKGAANILLPLLLVSFGNVVGGDLTRGLFTFLIGAAAVMAISAIYFALSWAFYTYRYEEGYLHIKAGILLKKERSIKKERVQTVNIVRGILHRIFGLASVQVETAGGAAESELKLTAVTWEEARRIKDNLESPDTSESRASSQGPSDSRSTPDPEALDPRQSQTTAAPGRENLRDSQKGAPAATATGSTPTAATSTPAASTPATSTATPGAAPAAGTSAYRVPFSELFIAGATSGGFLLLFALLGAAFSQLYPYIPETFWEFMLEQVTSTALATIVLLVFAILLISWLISNIIFMVQYADFTLQRSESRMQVTWGLIEQKQLTLQLYRLQAITIVETLLRQPFGMAHLTAEIAGGGSQEQEYVTILYPLLRRKNLREFLGDILPEYRLPESMNGLPPRSRKRYLLRALLVTLILVVPLQWLPYGWLGFILLIPAAILGEMRYRDAGTSLDGNQLALRFRDFQRSQVLMHKNHIQSLEISANPFQRWSGLCTIRASVLSSPQGKAFAVTDVDLEEARRIWQWYSRY